MALYKKHADRRSRPSLDEIITTLNSVVSYYSKVYIVLDGLDECADKDGTRSELITGLRSLQSRTNTNLMVTSRFITRVEQSFKGFPMLEIRASDADVKQFVAGQIYRLPNYIRRNIDLQVEIQDRIVQAVDGI